MYAAVELTATCIPCHTDYNTDRGFRVRLTADKITATTHDIQSLLLGGGIGFLTGQHGLVIDNLLQVRHSLLADPGLQYLNRLYRLLLLPRMEPLSQSVTPRMRTYSGPSVAGVRTSVFVPNLSSDYTRNAALSSPAMSSSQQPHWMI